MANLLARKADYKSFEALGIKLGAFRILHALAIFFGFGHERRRLRRRHEWHNAFASRGEIGCIRGRVRHFLRRFRVGA